MGAYEVGAAMDKCLPNNKPTGGKFGEGNAKSYLDWVEHRAKQIPGPGEYSIPGLGELDAPAPALGKTDRESSLDQMLREKRLVPGPGAYEVAAAHKAGVEPWSRHQGESTFTHDTHADALKLLLLEASRTPGKEPSRPRTLRRSSPRVGDPAASNRSNGRRGPVFSGPRGRGR